MNATAGIAAVVVSAISPLALFEVVSIAQYIAGALRVCRPISRP